MNIGCDHPERLMAKCNKVVTVGKQGGHTSIKWLRRYNVSNVSCSKTEH